MKIKLLVSLVVVVLAGLAIAALTGHLGSRVRIGVILPLTGPHAPIGNGMLNSIKLAVDEANEKGGVQGKKVSLVVLDDASDPEKAKAAARKLVADPTVLSAIVNFDPECSLATKDIFFESRLPTLAGVAENREPPDMLGDSGISIFPTGALRLGATAEYAWNKLGLRSFGYGSDSTMTGKAAVNFMRIGLGPLEGHPVIGGSFRVKVDETDFKPAIEQALSTKPELILFGGEPAVSARFLLALRAAGYTGVYETAMRYLSQEFIEAAGDKAEGTIQAFDGLPPDSFPSGKAYLDAYAAKGYSVPPSPFGIFAYSEAQSIIQAIDRSFMTRASVAGALRNEEFTTALGPVRYIYIGSTYTKVVIYQVVHGRWTPIAQTGKDPLPDSEGRRYPIELIGESK